MRKYSGYLVALIVAVLTALIILPAYGESAVIVIAVFYDEDTFIVEDSEGNRDLYEDRGDLVPGDKLIISGDKVQLIEQSSWTWFDLCVDGDIVASFLYAEDATWIKGNTNIFERR